jgi:putative ABC transport system ATP-binding protein
MSKQKQANGMAIETKDLWRIYTTGVGQEVPALRGLNIQVEKGTFVVLKGRSGSGKTTLLNIIGGLDEPTRGSVTIFGQDLAELDDETITDWRREKIGFIFQSFGLMPTLSAYENVELVPRISKVGGTDRQTRTLDMLELVGLRKWKDHRPYEMSGGQQQRVAIARALVNQPQLLIADEPTGELDTQTAREILSLFREIVEQEAVTLLMATHDALVDEYADVVLNLKDGVIAEED